MADLAAATDPHIGLPISGSYVITSKLAEGGMGAVYLAVNKLGSKKVVKFLLAEYSKHPAIRDRFDREAKAAARLKGKPHIVEIDDVGELPDGQQFMVMEHLSGRSLENHLREHGAMSPHLAFYIFVQIARGLHELHLGGVIHRDLKPGNIFLTNSADEGYRVKLIDLGIAHDSLTESAGFKTQTGTTIGTPGYMAPEQFDHANTVTSSADLYSLAIVMWEMLVGPGQTPWGYHDPRVLYFKQKTETPVFPSMVTLPSAWVDVLVSALSPHIDARPRSLYAFMATLASALAPDPSGSRLSGADMMARFARTMLNNAPIAGETVRAPDPHAIIPALYTPQRATVAPAPEPAPMIPANAAHATPIQPATVSQRPAPRAAAPVPRGSPSTLTASSGVALTTEPPPKRWPFAVGLAFCFAAGGVVFGLVYSYARRAPAESTTPTEIAPTAEPSTARVVVPLDAAVAALVASQPDAATTPDASVMSSMTTATTPIARAHTPPVVIKHEATSHAAHSTPTSPHPAVTPRAGSAAFDPDAVEQ